jgi:hypothetical protein
MGGVVADLWSLRAAVWVAAGASTVSALVVAVRMYETHQPDRLADDGKEPGDG